ncbi:MAG TPA: recombination protein RecR, partial [Bacteroidota bacterium]
MQAVAEPVARLIEEFSRLPGIGPKTAQRLTFFLLRGSREDAAGLAEAIIGMKEK